MKLISNYSEILETVGRYYTQKIKQYGPTAQGVDWNSVESQTLRFEQLLKVCDLTHPFSINDYGCGYGALVDYMTALKYTFNYTGFDISNPMVTKARGLYAGVAHCTFLTNETQLPEADYTITSGIFNVRFQISDEAWLEYILHILDMLNNLSQKGFAFNALTKYSDQDFMRPDLYYADPLFLFDHCKQKYSKYVALLHDYPLYEFTIIVRK